jgi:tRNA modification GTPase
VYDSVISSLVERAGFRFAEPGEFSRRAVLNGRLDLTAAEAVNDLVNAETEAQRQLALRQLVGGLSEKFELWAENILRVRAHLEAYIDFPDEEIPTTVVENVIETLTITLRSMVLFLDDQHKGERLRDGLRIAVVGPPNAGKSSLINWLADREVAIVSKHAGTTRDVIEVHLDLGGYPVVVADTAGLRDGGDEVEIEGMRRARDWAERADLRVLVLDATVGELGVSIGLGLCDGDLVLVNKIDLVDRVPEWPGSLAVSMARGDGLLKALERLTTLAREMMDVGGQPVMTRARHRAALLRCSESVERALGGLNATVSVETVAEDLRVAADDLGRVTGRVDVEELLDVVFRDFCIGK